MRNKNFLVVCLATLGLSTGSLALAKVSKKADKAKLAKECVDKGGSWDQKKKKCTAAAAAKADAVKENSSGENAGDSSHTPENPE